MYFFVFMLFILIQISVASGSPNQDPSPFVAGFAVIFILHVLTMIDMVGMLIYYVLLAMKNQILSQDMRLVWALLIFVGNIIAMPIYWYLYIWKEQAPTKAIGKTKK